MRHSSMDIPIISKSALEDYGCVLIGYGVSSTEKYNCNFANLLKGNNTTTSKSVTFEPDTRLINQINGCNICDNVEVEGIEFVVCDDDGDPGITRSMCWDCIFGCVIHHTAKQQWNEKVEDPLHQVNRRIKELEQEITQIGPLKEQISQLKEQIDNLTKSR